MDVFVTETDGESVINVWSTFEKAVEELVLLFGIDPLDLHELEREPGVWSAPTDMNMQCGYITQRTVDVKAPRN